MPMGWHDAPVLGETVSWVVVLHREKGESSLGAPEAISQMPEYVPLRNQGGVLIGALFVLIDGMAIMTADAELRTAWVRRILRNAMTFHVIIKNIVENIFAGVEFDSNGRRWRCAEAWNSEVTLSTPREVAVTLGRILWRLRVKQLPLLDQEELLRAYAWAGRENHLQREYDSEKPCPHADVIRRCCRLVADTDWSVAARPPPPTGRRIFLATDAWPHGVGYVEFDGAGKVTDIWDRQETERGIQSEMEMVAIGDAIVAKASAGDEVFLATDADCCRQAIDRGYSGSAVFRRELRRIRSVGCKVHACRVEGLKNVADAPSRGSRIVEETRRAQTWAALEALVQTAL